jgi:hypothetical protein
LMVHERALLKAGNGSAALRMLEAAQVLRHCSKVLFCAAIAPLCGAQIQFTP